MRREYYNIFQFLKQNWVLFSEKLLVFQDVIVLEFDSSSKKLSRGKSNLRNLFWPPDLLWLIFEYE